MTLRIRKIGGIDELNTFLRGGIIGGLDIRGGVYGLHGQTLVFTSPVAVPPPPPELTVTFATTPVGSQVSLTSKEIVAQINAVPELAGLASTDREGRLVIEDPAGLISIELDGTGTANALLGFSASGQEGLVYAPPGGVAPKVTDITTSPLSGSTYLLTTDE